MPTADTTPTTVCCDVGSALDNANARMRGFCEEHSCPLYEELKDIVLPTPAEAIDKDYQASVDTWIAEHMDQINAQLISQYDAVIAALTAIPEATIEALDEN